ncbi:HlyD family efflux transporter periplasmic adaptor subunit [Gloeobacter morelensis]|uniref:HlyD family efflux transporter periplasmic adaptor subunit n=1 Tax=Gloeobacter morelensis MG652769 TaxID=2781736 RepID=A0ABY3PL28_9CYAN|nr:HlyD family efflux transporter periplasmic adaptor subunit [Gloeobacter morelensis]UFP94263.1 HlyD family efflux transporter periplasmic adaptor subunit [Gloeobacter morelensis MG652769]
MQTQKPLIDTPEVPKPPAPKRQPLRQTAVWLVGIPLTLLALGGAIGIRQFLQPAPAPAVRPQVPAAPKAVTSLGRLEPEGEVIALSAPTFLEGARVAQVRVEEGQQVRRGQVVAVLDRRARLAAALAQTSRQVEVAQARLAQVQAGAKAGDLGAQRSAIARLAAELRIAQRELQRFEALHDTGAISASQLDDKRLVVETLNGQLQQARSALVAIAEVRPTDLRTAAAEIAAARAVEARARAELDTAYVRALQDGRILKIRTRPGEMVSGEPIAEMGRTERMEAVAEVYEDDLSRLRVGQKASVRSLNGAFSGRLQGTVYRIVPLIGKKDVLDTDPAADVDARVAEVRIRLDAADSRRVADLTNLKVEVAIDG